jgi:DNA-binding transcriptional ArsR family regulator
MKPLELDRVVDGLADGTRRGALQRLAQGPATAGQLARLFSVSRPAVSRHLRVLRIANLVSTTNSGRNIWYQANPEPLAVLETWIHDLAKRVADAPGLSAPSTRDPAPTGRLR